MKYTRFVFLPLLLVIIFLASNIPVNSADTLSPQDQKRKEQLLMQVLVEGLNAVHYQPVKIDDRFSEKVYEQYINRLDVTKRFLLQEDVQKLEKYRTKIDDQIKDGSFEFFNLSHDLITRRVKEAESYYDDILKKPFNFETEEEIETDPDKINFAANKSELKDLWRKYLKYQTLIRLNTYINEQEEAKKNSDTVRSETFQDLEAKARKNVWKSHESLFRSLSKVERSDRLTIYINSIMNTYDPHTDYFPPKDKEDFDIQMSGQLEGIGAVLQEQDGNIKVQRIVPGSASWKQGDLEVGDIIIKVGQAADEPVDVVDMRLDKAVQLIRGKKGTEVRLTVKKIDGSIIRIPIIRDVVIIEETYAKSALLHLEDNSEKIGYIKLPSFYADFSNPTGRRAAEDVRREVEKLKKNGISGIILDLRNNGGGSLQDVVDMAGLFIDGGPVVQVKGRDAAAHVYRDRDTRVQWDGPLIVMVNQFSASASEIMAAAMQDYGRAIIMGSNTFGKGTVQQFIDLDQAVPLQHSAYKPLGSLKITLQKFYRINGGATQLKGVSPDIELPDTYTYIEIGEKEMEHALPWSEIPAVQYNKADSEWSARLNELKERSRERVEASSHFQMIKENSERLKEQSDRSRYSLNYNDFSNTQQRLKQEAEKYKNMQKELESLQVTGLKEEAIVEDEKAEARKSELEEFHKNLKKDPQLLEALHVLRDIK